MGVKINAKKLQNNFLHARKQSFLHPRSFASEDVKNQEVLNSMTTTKKIYLGSDHNGFKLKEKLKLWLEKKAIVYEDKGDLSFDQQDDYPDYAEKVARAVVRNNSFGVLLCGSAQGVCIAANKVKGARAVVPTTLKEVRLSRNDDNANVLCLSGWFMHFHQATRLIEKFISTPFSEKPRHKRRLAKIRRMER